MTAARALWDLLTPRFRRAAGTLFVLMIGGMLLETLGIGLVIPALSLLVKGNEVLAYPRMSSAVRALGGPTREHLVFTGLLLLVVVFTIRALFLAFLSWRQMQFVFGLQADLSERLFAGYLAQPYTFHLERNSADLIRNALVETAVLTNVTQPGLIMLTESMAVAGMSVLLVVVEPLGTALVVGTLAASSWGFYRFTRKRSAAWGRARQVHEGRRLQQLQEGLGAAKEVKILGREAEFIRRYAVENAASARVSQHHFTLQQLPRLWLELILVFGLVALVLAIFAQGRPVDTVVPTLGLFAVAAFRVLPPVNRIVNNAQSIRYSLPAIHTLHSEFSLIRATPPRLTVAPFVFADRVTFRDVTFQYASTESVALRDINISIAKGEFVGFIGTTGAGKSTLVDVMLGLLTPASGSVNVDGVDIQTDVRAWQSNVGYVPQSIYLTDDTLRRNVAFGIPEDQIETDRLAAALGAAQLEEFVRTLPLGDQTVVGERGVRLSGGQCQRIGIARALYHNPSVLVLDEATSSLDVHTEREVMTAVRRLRGDKTIIIITHRLATVEQCDRVYRLEQGTIVEEAGGASAAPPVSIDHATQ